jgi:hypothetical protein
MASRMTRCRNAVLQDDWHRGLRRQQNERASPHRDPKRRTSALIATANAIWTAVKTTMRDAASLTATVTPIPSAGPKMNPPKGRSRLVQLFVGDDQRRHRGRKRLMQSQRGCQLVGDRRCSGAAKSEGSRTKDRLFHKTYRIKPFGLAQVVRRAGGSNCKASLTRS